MAVVVSGSGQSRVSPQLVYTSELDLSLPIAVLEIGEHLLFRPYCVLLDLLRRDMSERGFGLLWLKLRPRERP